MTEDQHQNGRNYLRAWREYRGLTQAQLAALVGTEGSVIGLLESGDRGLSNRWLQRLAPPLRTTPGLLLEHDPAAVDQALLKRLSLGAADASPIKAASTRTGKRAPLRARKSAPTEPYETHDPRVDPGYDIPEMWWRIADEHKPAALAALKALIPRN